MKFSFESFLLDSSVRMALEDRFRDPDDHPDYGVLATHICRVSSKSKGHVRALFDDYPEVLRVSEISIAQGDIIRLEFLDVAYDTGMGEISHCGLLAGYEGGGTSGMWWFSDMQFASTEECAFTTTPPMLSDIGIFRLSDAWDGGPYTYADVADFCVIPNEGISVSMRSTMRDDMVDAFNRYCGDELAKDPDIFDVSQEPFELFIQNRLGLTPGLPDRDRLEILVSFSGLTYGWPKADIWQPRVPPVALWDEWDETWTAQEPGLRS